MNTIPWNRLFPKPRPQWKTIETAPAAILFGACLWTCVQFASKIWFCKTSTYSTRKVGNKAQISFLNYRFINILTSYLRKVEKLSAKSREVCFCRAVFKADLSQRALMAPVPLNKQVPGYGSPNDCPLLLSIDSTTFCDIQSSQRRHVKPQLLV